MTARFASFLHTIHKSLFPRSKRPRSPMPDSPTDRKIPETEDEILELLQEKGYYKLMQFLVLSSMIIPVGMVDLSSIFFNLDPISVWTPSTNETESNEIPFGLYKSYNSCMTHNVPLENLSYRFNGSEVSIVGDMNLICGDYWKVAFSITLFFLGQMLANPLVGWFADRYGRRPTLIISNVFYTAVSLGLVFSKDYVSFVILRFLVGVGRQGINGTFFVLLLEWQVPRNRTKASAIVQFLYFFGGLLLGLVAYLLQDWHKIQLVMALCNAGALGFYWFGPESLRWLIMNNRVDEAKAICERIARMNGIRLEDDQLQCIGRLAKIKSQGILKSHHYTMIDLFRTRYLAIFSVVIVLFWTVIQIVNYGVAFVLQSIFREDGNFIYASFAISQALCLIPQGVNIYLTTIFKNRNSLIVYLLVGGVCLLVAAVVPDNESHSRKTVQAMAILGRMMVVGGHAAAMALSADLYPTVIRNNGMGLVNVALRIGSLAAIPLAEAADRARHEPGAYHGLPFAVMAAGCILAAIGTAVLPETKGIQLLTSIADAETFGKREMFSLIKNMIPHYCRSAGISEAETEEATGNKTVCTEVPFEGLDMTRYDRRQSAIPDSLSLRKASLRRGSIFTDGDVTTNHL